MRKTRAASSEKGGSEGMRHILVAVSGTSPQIVTETLYKLLVRKQPAPISEIHLLTTKKGAEIAWNALGGPDGAIARLCREYGIGRPILFTREKHIHVFKRMRKGGRKTEDSDELEDIRTSEDNEAMAAQALGIIKDLTLDPNSVLHCSVAGGRKTMSVYLMLALMLYGRRQDQLSHVLAPREFEANSEFFFPPKRDKRITVTINGVPVKVHTKDARIELAEIPFVRLREVLGSDVARVEMGLDELIRIAQRRIDRIEPSRLVIDLRQGLAWFGDQRLDLQGVNLALLAYYAKLKTESKCKRPDLYDCGPCHRECYTHRSDIDLIEFKTIFGAIYRKSKRHREAAPGNIRDENNIKVCHNRINKVIESHEFRIEVVRGEGRYGLSLDKTLIRIVE